MGRFWVFFLSHTALGFNCGFIFTSTCGSSTGVCSRGCPGRLELAPVRARCGGGAAAWVAGFLAAPGTQGNWRPGQQGIQCSRRVWQPVLANMLQYSCLEKHPPPDRGAWQATVYRVAKSWTRPSDCVHIDTSFFACGSSAPVRIECEGGAATWLAGSLVVPSVQGHGLPPLQELWPNQGLFSSLL